ncbi:MAG: hypothetical protein J7474_00580 [Arthrobacter sp.]|nr:hypothetical protein [Arthrobacter sp.]
MRSDRQRRADQASRQPAAAAGLNGLQQIEREAWKWTLYSDGTRFVLEMPGDRGTVRASLTAAEIKGYRSEGASYIAGLASRFANHAEALRARASSRTDRD